MEYFKNVILLSSEKDMYVPYHSARIEMCKEALADQKLGRVYRSMMENLLRPLVNKCNLVRLNVLFGRFTDLDGAIGRASHIRLLDNHTFTQMFVTLYSRYFD
jgi:hypothetical protein